jgi:hypothetical protein
MGDTTEIGTEIGTEISTEIGTEIGNLLHQQSQSGRLPADDGAVL